MYQVNEIIRGDCLNVLSYLGSETVDLTVCSPPYDNIRDYHGGGLDLFDLGAALYRVTKPGGVAAVVIGDGTERFAKSLTTARLAVNWVDNKNWRLFEQCIYSRPGRPGAWWAQRFRVDHEYILIFFKGERPKTFDKRALMVPSKHPGKWFHGTDRATDGSLREVKPKQVNPSKCRGTIWSVATSSTEGNRTKMQHPATMPDALARDLILCFSSIGDIILDPVCGSGTTCCVAANLGRQFIGIEISEQYCSIARQRLAQEVVS